MVVLHHYSVCEVFKMTEAEKHQTRIEYTLMGSAETFLKHDTELNTRRP